MTAKFSALFYHRYLNNTKQFKAKKKEEKIVCVSLTISQFYIQKLKLSNNGCDVPVSLPDVMTFCVWPRATFSCTVIRRISERRRVLGCVHLDRHREIESLSRTPHLLSGTSTRVWNSTRNPRTICYCFTIFEKWRLTLDYNTTGWCHFARKRRINLDSHLPLFVTDNTVFAITNY